MLHKQNKPVKVSTSDLIDRKNFSDIKGTDFSNQLLTENKPSFADGKNFLIVIKFYIIKMI